MPVRRLARPLLALKLPPATIYPDVYVHGGGFGAAVVFAYSGVASNIICANENGFRERLMFMVCVELQFKHWPCEHASADCTFSSSGLEERAQDRELDGRVERHVCARGQRVVGGSRRGSSR